MKEVRLVLEDGEHEELVKEKEKSGLGWHDFILEKCIGKKEVKKR